jgi:integrase
LKSAVLIVGGWLKCRNCRKWLDRKIKNRGVELMARKKAGKRADGEGTLRQRSDGRWESRITIGTNPATGKPIHKYFSGKGQQEVKKKRDEYLTKVATGTYIEPDKKTFGDWLGRYLTAFVKPKVKASTYSNYADLYKKHINPSIGEVPLQKLDTDTLQPVLENR